MPLHHRHLRFKFPHPQLLNFNKKRKKKKERRVMALQQQHDTNLLWQNLESLQVHCFLSVPAYFVLASVFHHMDSYSLFFQKKIELETRLLWPNQIKASALLSHQHVMCNHSVWKWFCFISNNFLLLTKKKKLSNYSIKSINQFIKI